MDRRSLRDRTGRQARGEAGLFERLPDHDRPLAAIAAEQQRWFSDVANRRDQVQAQSLALAGVQWARQIMQDDARSGIIDHLGEAWALPLPRTPLENGSIEGGIEDAQARLNINNLAKDDALGKEERARFSRLFELRGIAPGALSAIAGSLIPARANDDGLKLGNAPRAQPLPANLWPVRAAEVAALPGLGARDFPLMLPFVVALPSATVLNVNTASSEVLAAALPGLTSDSLAALNAERARKPFASLSDLRSRMPGVNIPDETTLGTSSSYFLVSVRARQGETRAQARALLRRDGREWPIVVWQTLE